MNLTFTPKALILLTDLPLSRREQVAAENLEAS